ERLTEPSATVLAVYEVSSSAFLTRPDYRCLYPFLSASGASLCQGQGQGVVAATLRVGVHFPVPVLPHRRWAGAIGGVPLLSLRARVCLRLCLYLSDDMGMCNHVHRLVTPV